MLAKKFPTVSLPILCFAVIVILFVCTRVWERNPATWLESDTNWRQNETLHLPLQQLLPWEPMAESSFTVLGAPGRAPNCAVTHNSPLDLVMPYSCASTCVALLLICAGFSPLQWIEWRNVEIFPLFPLFPFQILSPLHVLVCVADYLPLALRCTSAAAQLVQCQGQKLSHIDQKF